MERCVAKIDNNYKQTDSVALNAFLSLTKIESHGSCGFIALNENIYLRKNYFRFPDAKNKFILSSFVFCGRVHNFDLNECRTVDHWRNYGVSKLLIIHCTECALAFIYHLIGTKLCFELSVNHRSLALI